MQPQNRLSVSTLIGLDTESQPADARAPLKLVNMTVDTKTQGWRHAGGYERYVPEVLANYEPFTSLGRVDSVYVFSQNGHARYSILLESGGALYLLYEAGGSTSSSYYSPGLETVRATRTVPTATQQASCFATVGDRCLVTNGYDRPLLLTLWPLGPSTSVTSSLLGLTERTLGWARVPAAPGVFGVQVIHANATPSDPTTVKAGRVPLFCPVQDGAWSYPGRIGLGGSSASSENAYRYRVSFISDTGSESPVSDFSEIVRWAIPSGDSGFKYGVAITIPTGPSGTVARRIYRTANLGADSTGSSTAYFIADVNNNCETLFFDANESYGTAAPGVTESVTMPAPEARFCSFFQGCVFIDGGASQSRRLYYSNENRPDQFSAADYIELSSDGGGVTGLFAHYNMLVVMRESGVDIITGNYPNFISRTVSLGVSCRSPHSADSVPGVGVVFLTEQGVFALRGGVDGGSSIDIVELSRPIHSEVQRISREFSSRAVGRYCPNSREYHLYVAADGNDRPDLGLVYHVDKQGWSTRTGYPVGALDRLPNGDLVFGHNLGYVANENDETGLFVISRSMTTKGSLVPPVQQTPGYFAPGAAPSCIFSSPWLDMGDMEGKKQVQEVVLHVVASGDEPITVKFYRNHRYTSDSDGSRKFQPTDEAELSVFDKAVLGSTTSKLAAAWQPQVVVPVRFPTPAGACGWFRFEVEAAADITIVGYDVIFAASSLRPPTGRGA